MKKGLTKRERNLIIFAGALAILFASVQFAILPAYWDFDAAVTEYDRLDAEKRQLDLKLNGEVAAIQNNENMKNVYQEILARYPGYMSTAEVSKRMTEFCRTNGLTVATSIRVSDYKRPKEDEPGAGVLVSVTVDMAFEGSFNDLLLLIEAVEALDYLRIGRVDFSFGDSSSENAQAPRMTVFFVYTMLEPADIMLAPPSEEPPAQTA
jgi:hypothetical protein